MGRWGVQNPANAGKINTLVTVDAVSTFGNHPDFNALNNSVNTWDNVNATERPTSNIFSNGNFVAGFGNWGDAPKGYSDIFISAPFDHGDFNAMMNTSNPTGKTPQQIIGKI